MEENQKNATCEQTVESTQAVEFVPESNLVWAVLCTVLCCLPLGIPAIVKACSVERLWMQGFKEEARLAADQAKKYSIWGAIIAVIVWILYFIFVVLTLLLPFAGAAVFAQ